jgi:hypothetical protein
MGSGYSNLYKIAASFLVQDIKLHVNTREKSKINICATSE